MKINKLKLKLFFTRQVWIYLFHISSVCLCCYITNKWIEGISFVFAHCVLRYKFKYQYHSENHCCALTTFIIWTAISTIKNITYNLLFSIFIAFLICWAGDAVQEKITLQCTVHELEKEIKNIKAKFKKDTTFNLKTCTKDEFLCQCRKNNLSKDSTDIAVLYFYEKSKTLWDLATEYNIEYDSIKKRTNRIKKYLLKS